jgi:16S rRNA (adenine1518-N6/adenine1519-N6)-dimethyltransferase
VGNIPYNITSAILEKLIADKRRLKKVVLCVQKEYGDKLMAHIGDADYGNVTLYVNYHFHVRKEFSVPARFFSPRPKVSSVVVTLMPKAAELDEVQEKDLFRFIAGVFRYRRKSVKNAVINYAEKLPQYLDDGILRRRPQHLSFDDFCRIYMGLVNES